MLAQFQVRYPTGSLISELLQIYQGKFIVRVSVNVEGVTRATGMAAAETLEMAEDRARSRALAVLLIQQTTQEKAPPQPVKTQMPTNLDRPFTPIAGLNDAIGSFSQASPQISSTAVEDLGIVTDTKSSNTEPLIPFDNLMPMVSPHSNEDNLPFLDQTRAADQEETSFPVDQTAEMEMGEEVVEEGVGSYTSEPVDLSDAIARTSAELQRLGWNNQKGRDYLKQTYGKISRQYLTDEELLEFLEYLKSQPSPKKP